MLLVEGLEGSLVLLVDLVGVGVESRVQKELEPVASAVVSVLGVSIVVVSQSGEFTSLPGEVGVEEGGIEGREAE